MAYFFQVKDKNGRYKLLNIEQSSMFQDNHISKTYKRTGGYSIQELDRFTMLFDDEVSLRNHLICSGILPIRLQNQELAIRFINRNRSRRYNLLFKDDLEYFYVPDALIDLITNKYYEGDFKFLNALARNFYFERECSSTACDLLNLSELAIKTGIVDNGFREYDSNGDNVVKRLVKLLIYKYRQHANGHIEYSEEYNWRTFHLLIDFIKTYDEKQIAKEANVITSPLVTPNKPKTLQKVLDNKNEEFQQLSFSDLDNN